MNSHPYLNTADVLNRGDRGEGALCKHTLTQKPVCFIPSPSASNPVFLGSCLPSSQSRWEVARSWSKTPYMPSNISPEIISLHTRNSSSTVLWYSPAHISNGKHPAPLLCIMEASLSCALTTNTLVLAGLVVAAPFGQSSRWQHLFRWRWKVSDHLKFRVNMVCALELCMWTGRLGILDNL